MFSIFHFISRLRRKQWMGEVCVTLIMNWQTMGRQSLKFSVLYARSTMIPDIKGQQRSKEVKIWSILDLFKRTASPAVKPFYLRTFPSSLSPLPLITVRTLMGYKQFSRQMGVQNNYYQEIQTMLLTMWLGQNCR